MDGRTQLQLHTIALLALLVWGSRFNASVLMATSLVGELYKVWLVVLHED